MIKEIQKKLLTKFKYSFMDLVYRLISAEEYTIFRVMRAIYYNPEKLIEKTLKEMYKEEYTKFSQFCLGGKIEYAREHPTGFKLTQDGVRAYFQLKADISKRAFNFLLVFVTGLLVLATLILVLK